jgi:hypothetical protein
MTIDDLTAIGIDGIRRSFDEHYDTMMEVEQDPTGAHHAIQNQHTRIEELEAKLAKALRLAEEAFDFNIEDAGPRAWHSINDRIEELKGQ